MLTELFSYCSSIYLNAEIALCFSYVKITQGLNVELSLITLTERGVLLVWPTM